MDYEKNGILAALKVARDFKVGRGHIGYMGVPWAVVDGLMDFSTDAALNESQVGAALTELIREGKVRISLRGSRLELSLA